MIGFSGLGVGRKARKFNYSPRYWDAEKEEREERRRAILGEQYEQGEYKPGMLIREGRLRRMQSSARVQRKSRSTIIRAAIFVIMVFAALYFFTDFASLLVK